MSDAPANAEKVASNEEVVTYLRGIAQRVVDELAKGLEAGAEVKDVVAMVADGFGTDAGLLAILGAAFDDGREDAASRVAVDAAKVDPVYKGLVGGEARATWREETICLRCDHSAVCSVHRSTQPEMLISIRRCLAFRSHAG